MTRARIHRDGFSAAGGMGGRWYGGGHTPRRLKRVYVAIWAARGGSGTPAGALAGGTLVAAGVLSMGGVCPVYPSV